MNGKSAPYGKPKATKQNGHKLSAQVQTPSYETAKNRYFAISLAQILATQSDTQSFVVAAKNSKFKTTKSRTQNLKTYQHQLSVSF